MGYQSDEDTRLQDIARLQMERKERSKAEKRSRSKIYREKCKAEGKCIRCGQDNERLPLTLCGLCSIKTSFCNEKWSRKVAEFTRVRVTKLESRVLYLEEKVAWLTKQLKNSNQGQKVVVIFLLMNVLLLPS